MNFFYKNKKSFAQTMSFDANDILGSMMDELLVCYENLDEFPMWERTYARKKRLERMTDNTKLCKELVTMYVHETLSLEDLIAALKTILDFNEECMKEENDFMY